ncbi:MAG: NADH-ubiquinone oxidoreductase-F iron-sulfur binding region domain-containing protein [Myxococcota bacterium]|nr:NADH-ubiquinone oxidoreductase-F iron-sulfur binding region domain-containing protein [Myxococcota bacterium]
MTRIGSPEDLANYRTSLLADRPEKQRVIAVCAGTGCNAYGSRDVVAAFREELDKCGLNETVALRPTGCHGFCERGTLVLFHPDGVLYQRVKAKDVPEIVEKTVRDGQYLEQFFYEHPVTGEKYKFEKDIPFYKHQNRLILGKNGFIDPTSIDDYIATGGYNALVKAFELGPDRVLDEVKQAKLRGRGGGGFPAGRKWETCRNAASDKRYVICNADEGDPGAFMDRSILEGNPHSVIEGMIIGALTIGSDEGYVYVRHEYPLAVERLGIALKQARDMGFLGKNILGQGLDFDITINRGGGAFVCGESTALMASIEGKVGEPRAKHIHTVVSGLYDKPSNLNNVETWANVPLIVQKGAKWYTSIGTDGSPGTKIFSLVGKVNNTGLVEAPMGMTLRQIIYDVGGGIVGGKAFKAVQTGGPSGGCLPADKLDLPVDFDTLWEEGSMMGSGGMIVMDERTCMVDVAKYFLGFLKFESCGKCTTCREGLRRLHQLVTDITEGRGTAETISLIEELADTVEAASLCALGTTAINPVRSTLKLFREEYEAHVNDKKCPAAVCKSLITFTIDPKACTGCLLCKSRCPQEAVIGTKKKPHSIIQEKCIQCGICEDVCKDSAVIVA